MSDQRLEEWLALSQRVLSAQPADRAHEFVCTEERRAELQASLEEEPPLSRTSSQLARALRESENAIQKLGDELRSELSARLEELRKVRNAAQGYRPTRGNRPAFVSRSV